ncbi:MAG: hypothetical protein QHJ73_17480, partial [Armatimonadota bacterium]|nr:hypothetical protein [Armatimonadota bacterium]
MLATFVLVGCGVGSAWAQQQGSPAAPTVTIHGYAQNRFYAAKGAELEFRSERISLWADANWQNGGVAHTEFYFHPWTSSNGLYVESAYYDTKLGSGRIRIGRGRRTVFGITPSYSNRRTSNYGLVAEAITQDRVQGVQYNLTRPTWDLGVGVHTALRPGTRLLGDIPGDDMRNTAVPEVRDAQGNVTTPLRPGCTVPHLSLRDPHAGSGNPTTSVFPGGATAVTSPNQLSRHLQVAARVGVKPMPGLSAGLSGSYSHLDARDFANLRGDPGCDNV